jgi:hypothetical protein
MATIARCGVVPNLFTTYMYNFPMIKQICMSLIESILYFLVVSNCKTFLRQRGNGKQYGQFWRSNIVIEKG